MKNNEETRIQNDIEAAIGAEQDLAVLRNSVGVARFADPETGKLSMVRYGLGTGSPDIVGMLTCEPQRVQVAQWFCLEVKIPGESARPDQRKWHEAMRKRGVYVAVVHSVDEAREALKRARELYQ